MAYLVKLANADSVHYFFGEDFFSHWHSYYSCDELSALMLLNEIKKYRQRRHINWHV